MTLTITKRLNGPTTIEGDLDDLDRLPELARARRRVRERFVPFALLDELTHPRLIGYVHPRPTRGNPYPRRYLALLDLVLLEHTQPKPLRRKLNKRSRLRRIPW